MAVFGRRKAKENALKTQAAQRTVYCSQPVASPFRLACCTDMLESGLYDRLRAEVPVIDACFGKIIRLVGDFTVKAEDEAFQRELDRFCREVRVGVSGKSIYTFADMYLDSLLTYGKAVGMIIADQRSRSIKGLAVADSSLYHIKQGRGPLDMEVYFDNGGTNGTKMKVRDPERLLYTALNPSPKHPEGVSLLRGLPAISSVLMRIYQCIGQNFDRVGNVRYAVTYKPTADGDRIFAKERAKEIAAAWSDGMQSAKNGIVKDFVAVGDVDVKVIGAENQIIDTEVPVRQLLEQIAAKLSVPPFLLGLNWSTTERMSAQQADILTSELEYYRRLLTPVLEEVCSAHLRLCGCGGRAQVEWANINLQDEEALAKSRLYNAQAREIELRLEAQENSDNKK